MQLYSIGVKMVRPIKLYKSFDIKDHHKRSIILIGNFDGLHLRHQKLFKLANRYKRKLTTHNTTIIDRIVKILLRQY